MIDSRFGKSGFILPNLRETKSSSIFWLVIVLFLFLSTFLLSGRNYTTEGADPSWNAVVEYAAEHSLQAGSDIIFTTGPLGFLNIYTSTGRLLPVKAAFAFLWTVAVVLASVGLARNMRGPLKYLLIIWILFFSYVGKLEHHAGLIFAYAAMTWLGLISVPALVSLILFLVVIVLSQVKYTFFLNAVGVIAIIFACKLGQRKIRPALFFAAITSGSFLLLWFLSRQGLTQIPAWISGSYEIASGYSRAMSLSPKPHVLIACLLACFITAAAVFTLMAKHRRDISRIGFLVALGLLIFLTWKHGIVRADAHVFWLIVFLPPTFGFLLTRPIAESLSARSFATLCTMFVIVCLLCVWGGRAQSPGWWMDEIRHWPDHIADNAKLVGRLLIGDSTYPFMQTPEEVRRMQADARLFEVNSLVGQDPVDVFNYGQGAAILNNLNYQPRPIFQSYSAYTPELQQRNMEFYLSERRPPFVLFSQETIDKRFPTLDDALVLPFLFKNYTPIAREQRFLLMQVASPFPIPPELHLVHEQKICFDEVLDISSWNEKPVFLAVDMKPTLWGRILQFLYKPPAVFMHCQMESADIDYRYVPSMGELGFMVSPLVSHNQDIFDLMMGLPEKRLRKITFRMSTQIPGQMERSFSVRIYQASGFPEPDRVSDADRDRLKRLKYSMFDPVPIAIDSGHEPDFWWFDSAPALRVHPPGSVTLPIPKGAIEAIGSFGILDVAYTIGNTDGVEFLIIAEDDQGKRRTLLSRHLQPRERDEDRGLLKFRVPIDSGEDQRLILITRKGPNSNADWDWSVWSNVRFRQLSEK